MPTGKELLLKTNIYTNCKALPKEHIIKEIGNILIKNGYVNENYIDAMLKREISCSTYLGAGIAMPHGVDEAKKDILKSGMTVMIFPEGTNWDDNKAHIVIGLAGKDDEHLEILGNLAQMLLNENIVEKLIEMNQDEVYEVFCDS